MLQVLMSTREVMYEIDALFKRKPYSEMTDLITDNYKIVYFNKKRPMRGSFHGYTSIHLVSLQSPECAYYRTSRLKTSTCMLSEQCAKM